jgi:ACT domain-containing protein
MVMLVDVTKCAVPFSSLADELTDVGTKMNLKIHVMNEDIFNAMHHI